VASPLHPNYRPDIDGLRAVAVLPVLMYHAFPGWMPSGFVGVDIFFVISGFLISTVIMGNLEAARFSYLDFYSRRIRRIFPALAVMLIAVLAFGWVSLFPVEFAALGKHVLGGATFVANFFLWNESGYFDTSAESKPLLHLWSLGIEEQYYIFWPLILSIAWRNKTSLLLVIVSMGGASFLFCLLEIAADPVATFYSPVTRVWELMLGSALAYVFTVRLGQRRTLGGGVAMFSSLIGTLLVLTGFLLITDSKPFPGWWAVFPTLGSLLLIAGGPGSGVNRWLLSNRWMVLVGKISFPLYLWHWPLLSFAQILYSGSPPAIVKILLLLTTFMLAWITYRFVERPIRYGEGMFSAAMPLMAIAAVVALLGAFIYLENGFTSRSIVAYNRDLLRQTPFAANPPSPCPGMANDVISKNKLCTIYPAAVAAKTIVLWGDSSTGAWLPVFLDIGKQHNFSIVNLSHPSCPPLLSARKTRFDYKESREYCRDGQMQRLAIQEIARLHPDLIVVLSNWNSYSGRSNREFITDRPDEVADTTSTQRTLSARVPETLEALTQVSRIVVFRSWPIMPIARNMKIARTLAIPGIEPTHTTDVAGPTVSRSEFSEDSRNINFIFDQLGSPRLSFFDPSAKICASGTCESHVNGINYYSDAYHISTAGALSFRADIEALLER
jgi:peptidoglycan/LPS O-acetylase OafA/YrhL